MATVLMPHGILGRGSLVGVSGPPLTLSRRRSNRDCHDRVSIDSSSCAIRALSGKFCSTSKGLKIVGHLEAKGRGSVVVASSPGGDEFPSGRSSFPLATDAVQFVDIDQNSVGRNSGSAISSLGEDAAMVESLESGAMPMYQPRWIWFAESAEEEKLIIDRAINAAILGSAGFIALSKVLTVDHDYWRGWTSVEILEYAPLHNWFAYEALLRTHPVLAKMMISGTVYSIGDWIAQCYAGKPVLQFDRLRVLRSGLVGFCLHGSLSHFYYHFCEWLFPFQGWWVVPAKVGFDQTVWSAVWNVIYFTTIGLLRFEHPGKIFQDLRETFFPLLTAGWKLWPLAHVVTYGFVPVEQRLLWVDCVEILWVTIMAMYSNEKSEARKVEAELELKESAIDNAASQVFVDEVVVDEIRSSNSGESP